MSTPTPKPPAKVTAALKSFIQNDPKSEYTFDSERESSQSEICRSGDPNSRECITLQMNARDLFKAMQDQGFFCALPMDPSRTYMSCRPIPN